MIGVLKFHNTEERKTICREERGSGGHENQRRGEMVQTRRTRVCDWQSVHVDALER